MDDTFSQSKLEKFCILLDIKQNSISYFVHLKTRIPSIPYFLCKYDEN